LYIYMSNLLDSGLIFVQERKEIKCLLEQIVYDR
jgi:hypothetical protein